MLWAEIKKEKEISNENVLKNVARRNVRGEDGAAR